MLEIVSNGFRNAKAALTGRATITEDNISEAVREIRVSLLEADVEIGVVRTFLDRVKQRAIGEVVQLQTGSKNQKKSVSPGEHFVLICHNELEKLMGPSQEAPIVYRKPYTIIMMVGLQGTGKTTTTGKLAKYLLAQKRKPLLVAADIYRPAAVDQLKVLGGKLGVPVYAQEGVAPPQLCQDALREARRLKRDVVIFDTAGRLAIDEALMAELDDIKQRTKPDNIFLVCDAMAGQDTVRTASEFNRRLDLTGFVMTKLDGDARGGAALTIKEITGKPIKFLGTGEGLEKLEPFRPEGLASRILGMGDVVGLMKDFESIVDEKEAERDTKKLLRGQFTLDDFLKQLRMLQQVGSVKEIYEKFPIFGDSGPPEGVQMDDKTFVVMESLIQSMTPKERATPSIIDDSRAKRIALGSGRKPEQVKDLIGRFQMMQQMMASFASQPGLLGQLPGFKQLSQIRNLKGMKGLGLGDVGDSIRAMTRGRAMPGGMPTMPGIPGGLPGMQGGFPGFPGAGAFGNAADTGPALEALGGMGALPPGITPEAYQRAMEMMQGKAAGARVVNAKTKQKSRDKAKAARKARKKARKK